MTRARILADYVSSGDELALKAPIAGPTFTGTVAIPNVANLETAVVANTAKTSGSTNASDLASGTLAIARMAAGSVVYADGFTFTSTDAQSTPGTAWVGTSLTITIPSANAAQCSKIIVMVSNEANVRADSNSCCATRIKRSAPSESIIANLHRLGDNGGSNTFPNISMIGTDEALGSGDHTYIVDVSSGLNTASYMNAISYHGDTGAIVSISVIGIV